MKRATNALLAFRQRVAHQLRKERPSQAMDLMQPRPERGSYRNLAIKYFDFPTWLYRFDDGNRRGWTVNINSYKFQREKHINDVSTLLAAFRSKASGNALRNAIGEAGNELLIYPYFNFKIYPVLPWRPLGFNATATRIVDTGEANVGSDSSIMFSAHMWGWNGQRGTSGESGPGSDADDLLYHELVHGLRTMIGANASDNKLNNNYDNEEEFIAITLSNIYLAEKGKRTLRGSHHDFSSLPQPERFLKNPKHKQLLRKFEREQNRFFKELSNIPEKKAWWNPLRELRDVEE